MKTGREIRARKVGVMIWMNGPIWEGERKLAEEFENCPESDIARRFALLLRCVTDSVFDDILILSIEDFALPEGHDGKDDEDNPNGNDQHSHDGVPDEETVQVENVTKSTDSGNPTDCKYY